MSTTSPVQPMSSQGLSPKQGWLSPELTIYLTIAWNLIVVGASLFAMVSLLGLDDFYNLGKPVQYFAAFVSFIPALVGIYSTIGLLQSSNRAQGRLPGRAQGRLAAMGLHYIGAVLAFVYLLHLWGFYNGMDSMSAAIYENRGWLWALVASYLIYWLAGRFDVDSAIHMWLDRIGLGLGMIALIGMLWFSGLLGALADVLGTYDSLQTWLVTIAIIIFAFVAYSILLLSRYLDETPEQRTAWQGWLMLSPNIIGFTLFFAGPLLLSLYISFTNSPPGNTAKFVGFENYAKVLNIQIKTQDDLSINAQKALDVGYVELDSFKIGDTRYVVGAQDRLFWISLKNTIWFSLFLVPLSTIPALIIAITLNSKLPGMKFFRSIYFLPSVAAVVGVGVIWRNAMYSSIVGYINYSITGVIDFLNGFGLGITDPKVVWLSEAQLFAIVVMAAWQIVGFNTVLYLAGLQGIPNTLYEAAQVDGANKWDQFRHVTLPLLGPTTFFVVVTTLINGLQVFNEPYVLFGDPPPEGGITSVFYLYRSTFFGSNFGYSSAIAWLVFIVIFMITLVQFRVQRSNPYGD